MNQYTASEIVKIIETLNQNLPEKVPMSFSKNIDLRRAIILRESIFFRIKELAESTYDACLKNRLVSAILLARGLIETEAFFIYFLNKLEQAIKNNNLYEINEFLTKALRGARSPMATKEFSRPNAINVLTCIDLVDKKIQNYRDQYEFLSEFSHPNSAGLNKIYCKYDWESNEIIFGNNREKINIEFLLNQLGVSLENFISKYNYSVELFEQSLASEQSPLNE